MPVSLDGPPTIPPQYPSSRGLPLQPFTPPGTLQVPLSELRAFLSSFPPPPGVAPLLDAGQQLAGGLAEKIARDVQSGDAQRVLAAIAQQTVQIAPNVLEAGGALLGGTGALAGLLGPAALAIPKAGPIIAGVLEVYAPLASVGGATVGGLAAAARYVANAAQQNAQAAAAAGAVG